jgi:signal-transduction protein with cAMP-binding, CBS, and nucleotidyltransferase domain
MENIIRKIRQIYPVSDEALQALQANMELRYYPKDTRIVQAGVTDRLVYFIEEGIARSVFYMKMYRHKSPLEVSLYLILLFSVRN